MTSPIADQLHALIAQNLREESQGALKEYLETAAKAIEKLPGLEERIGRLRVEREESRVEQERLRTRNAVLESEAAKVKDESFKNVKRAHELEVLAARQEGAHELHAGTVRILDKILANRVIREEVQQNVTIPVVRKTYGTEYSSNGNMRSVANGDFVEDHSKTETTETTTEEG